jgi:hypothetical protein
METTNRLEQLSRLAQTLNKETDAYTESLAQLEGRLRQISLGVEAWVRLEAPNSDDKIVTMLGYAKTPEGWGFAIQDARVERGFFEGNQDCPWENHYNLGDPRLLLKSSRELRILAASRMEELLAALEASANNAVAALQKAQQLAAKF